MDTIIGIVVGVLGTLAFVLWSGARAWKDPKVDPKKAGEDERKKVLATDPHAVVQSLDNESRSAIADITKRAIDSTLRRIRERGVHPGG